jgi:hypothetical protein
MTSKENTNPDGSNIVQKACSWQNFLRNFINQYEGKKVT